MIRNSRVMFVILLALLLPIHVCGQSAASGPPPSEGALFLLLPVGAEGVSLGRTMTAVRSAESAFWNPAGLPRLAQTELVVMVGNPLPGKSTALSWLISPLARLALMKITSVLPATNSVPTYLLRFSPGRLQRSSTSTRIHRARSTGPEKWWRTS